MAVTWIAIGIGAGGLVIAGGTLGWQVRSYLRSGPVVRVSTLRAKMLAVSPDRTAQRVDPATLTTTATNVGRMPATVVAFGNCLTDSRRSTKVMMAFPGDPPGPVEIAAFGGHSFQPAREPTFVAELRRMGCDRAQPYVITATGEMVHDRHWLEITPDGRLRRRRRIGSRWRPCVQGWRAHRSRE